MTDKLPISNALLIRLAGEPAFYRGMGYFETGQVLGFRQKKLGSYTNGTYLTAIVGKSTCRHGLFIPENAVKTSL